MGKESACNAGDPGNVGRSPGEGNGNPLQYSCLENPMDRGVWWATIHGVMNMTLSKLWEIVKDNPLQCSFQENSMDRGAWWATVHEVGKNGMLLNSIILF